MENVFFGQASFEKREWKAIDQVEFHMTVPERSFQSINDEAEGNGNITSHIAA